MCLIVDLTKHPDKKPIILTKKLKVYKFLLRNTFSGKREWKGVCYGVPGGYRPKQNYLLGKPLVVDRFDRVNEGFHAYISKPNKNEWNHTKISIFYYPVGTNVFYGERGDIVGDMITAGCLKPIKY